MKEMQEDEPSTLLFEQQNDSESNVSRKSPIVRKARKIQGIYSFNNDVDEIFNNFCLFADFDISFVI